MYTFLRLLNGSRAGSAILLDAEIENYVGRGLDCHVVLTDPLSSRVHATIVEEQGQWWIRDADSRNGTYVNGQKIDNAQLEDGCQLRIGSAEFIFQQREQPPEDTAEHRAQETIVRDASMRSGEASDLVLAALRDPQRVHDFLLLYQLSLRLLSSESPTALIQTALELLHERTGAAVVGFLWMNENQELIPKLVVPEEAEGSVQLSQTLTEQVVRRGRAVWIANAPATKPTDSLGHYADAICVPLIRDKAMMGALHIYREQKGFQQDDFEVALSLATLLGAALARARRQEVLQAEHERLVAKSAAFSELVGGSKPMEDLKSKIARLAKANGCVLVRGESGVGKELVARAIHRASGRADRPMLTVNCAAIPRELVESQLFGHKKGAFTGADADHVGWFQQADTGTLFLDEVGELTLEGQAKLLRILEGHPFLPVGGSKQIQVDVRVIAATNRDLRQFVAEKRFREDLYYRLSVFELVIPPLRDRDADIGLLIDHFLEHFKLQHGRPGLTLSDAARRKLLSYGWPGNVRQLRNVIDSAVVLADGETIDVSVLGLREETPLESEWETLMIDHWERKLISIALERTQNNVPEAAKLLGIGRATLYRKIDEYQIPRP